MKLHETLFTPPLAVPPSSVTVTVMMAVPIALCAGAKLSEPVAFGLA